MFSHPFGLYPNADTISESMARVIKGAHGVFEIGTPDHTFQAHYKGETPPVTGDWVHWRGDENGAIITHVLPRFSSVARKAAGTAARTQLLAANLHHLLIVTAPDRDFNPRRLERYLAMAWDGGVMPVLVLNKIDLTDDLEPYLDTLHDIAPGVDVVPIAAAHAEDGLHALEPYHRDGRTIALVGSSGVGKSTIVNQLTGLGAMRTNSGRDGDGKGRHTTTHRELHRIPGGGIVIDTPGLREIQPVVDQAALNKTFSEIPDHATACRFRNCTHNGEPGCAVRQAVNDGILDEDRLNNYHKMGREMRYLNSKTDKHQRLAQKRAEKSLHKMIRIHKTR